MPAFRVEIDGKWTAYDMASFFQVCEDVYNFHCLQMINPPPHDPSEILERLSYEEIEPQGFVGAISAWVRRTLELRIPDQAGLLRVTQIRYGSKGFHDIYGAGEAAGHLKDFLLKNKELRQKEEEQKVKVEGMKLENEERRERLKQLEMETQIKRLELLRRQVKTLEDSGFSKKVIREAILGMNQRADVIDALVANGKILQITGKKE